MWNDNDTPLAYFISFRSYGTWLHGDKRGSIDRFHNRFGDPYLPRRSVRRAVGETCNIRKWNLHALNVRTNHVHTVVTANVKPELVLNALKASATRQLREDHLWRHAFSPWADKGSKIRLWNERSVANAINYVLNGQGDDLPDFDE